MKICCFCSKEMQKVGHHNTDLFDVYVCQDCLFPDYRSQYRELYRIGQNDILAANVRIDEFYVVLNYQFNYTNKRTNYTTIYRGAPKQLVDTPVCDVDLIINLPYHDPAALKRKLRLYTLFS